MKAPAPTEFGIQCAAAKFLTHALPPDAWFTAIDHATKSAAEGDKKKRMGVKPGIADMMILHQKHVHWIEMKRAAGKVSAEQEAFSAIVRSQGHTWHRANSVEDVEAILRGLCIPLRATTMTARQADTMMAMKAAVVRKPAKPRQPRPDAGKLRKVAAIRSELFF